MSDVSELVHELRFGVPDMLTVKCAADALETLAGENERLVRECNRLTVACAKTESEVKQILGKALGYPWFKDDQTNFPGTTERDGVCVGDHVAASLAMEAVERLAKLAPVVEAARALSAEWECAGSNIGNFVAALDEAIATLEAANDQH